MAYPARAAIDRIRFAIKHAEQSLGPCVEIHDANLQLLDALGRLGGSRQALSDSISNSRRQKRKD